MLKEPLEPKDSRPLIRRIADSGNIIFPRHARDEMANDGITRGEAVNVLWHGKVGFPEMEKGTWRYRVETPRAAVIVVFRSETELAVVTVWRKKR